MKGFLEFLTFFRCAVIVSHLLAFTSIVFIIRHHFWQIAFKSLKNFAIRKLRIRQISMGFAEEYRDEEGVMQVMEMLDRVFYPEAAIEGLTK